MTPAPLRRPLGPLVTFLAMVVMTLLALPAGAAAETEQTSEHTILVGTGGIIWADVSAAATPRLWGLLRDGSGAALTVRSVNTTTCPVDAWLGVSAGERASAPALDGNPRRASWEPCPEPSPLVDGRLSEWDEYVAAASELRFNSVLGTLGDVAADQGACITAVGEGAAVGAARSDGSVENYVEFDPSTLPEALTACQISLVDVGSLPQSLIGPNRASELAAIDSRIGAVLDAAPEGANIVVASMADDGSLSRLRMALGYGPDYRPGVLYSPSTRQPGLVVNNDLTTTMLGRAGLEIPSRINGGVLITRPDSGSGTAEEQAEQHWQSLVDYDLASFKIRSIVPTFFQIFVYGQLVVYLLVLLVWKGKLGSEETRARWLSLARVVAVSAAAVPAATFLANLVPWWRTSWPLLAIVASVAAWTAIIAVVALRGPWGRSGLGPVAVVSAVTVVVLGVDVMTGSRLQLSSLMGLQPAIGGRYFGLGNVPFALFITSAIFLATVVANGFLTRGRKVAAAWSAGLILTVALVVNGAPMWGADAGGPLSLPPAIAFFVLTMLGITVTLRRWVLLFAATGALFLSVAFLDSLRPLEDQSHLGRFFESISDGRALDIMVRKAEQNWNVLTGNYTLTLLVPFALAFVIYVLARETSWGSRALQRSFDRYPALRTGLMATLVALTIGFFVNDSGVAIPAVGATIAVPLLIAINVWVLRSELLAPGQWSDAEGPAPATSAPTPPT